MLGIWLGVESDGEIGIDRAAQFPAWASKAAPSAEVENNRRGESLREKVMSSSVHTVTLALLQGTQRSCPGGEEVWEEVRQIK